MERIYPSLLFSRKTISVGLVLCFLSAQLGCATAPKEVARLPREGEHRFRSGYTYEVELSSSKDAVRKLKADQMIWRDDTLYVKPSEQEGLKTYTASEVKEIRGVGEKREGSYALRGLLSGPVQVHSWASLPQPPRTGKVAKTKTSARPWHGLQFL